MPKVTDPKKKKFLEKHKPLTPKQIKQKQIDMEKAREKFTRDIQEIQDNLTDYFERDDPLVEPASDKVLAWVKRPSMKELQVLIPPDELTEESTKNYLKQLYKMMEDFVTIPKHNADWWEQNATGSFIALFQTHFGEILNKLGGETENF